MNATEKRTGQTVELARYVTDLGEERLLVGRRVDGVIRIYDRPMSGDRRRGRSYFVDAGFESMREIAMVRRDYLEQAERLGDCPMSGRALRRLVETRRREESVS